MIGCLCFLILMAIEYIITVGLVKLITLCFGLSFSWLIATGVWAVIVLISGLVRK